MSRPHPRKITSHAQRRHEELWRLSTGDDLENVLHSAERLLQQAEERQRHEQNRTFALTSLIAGTALSVAAYLYILVDFLAFGTLGASFAATLSLMAIVTILGVEAFALMKQRRRAQFNHTLQLAAQLASMINEALVDVAEREQWSYLRVQATKLRLSAFPLPQDQGSRS